MLLRLTMPLSTIFSGSEAGQIISFVICLYGPEEFVTLSQKMRGFYRLFVASEVTYKILFRIHRMTALIIEWDFMLNSQS